MGRSKDRISLTGPNTGRTLGEDAQLVTATQTIYHDTEQPSYVELPVAPGVRIQPSTP